VNAQEIRQKFRTLDAAVSEIERLHKAGNPAQPAAKTATAATAPKAPGLPAIPPSPAPKLSDLSREEITEAMDICNRQGDTDTLAVLYRELQERRRPI
jgi:hypothetical protein